MHKSTTPLACAGTKYGAILLLLLASLTTVQAQTYRIMGSDLMADVLPKALEPIAEQENLLLDYQLTGTVASLPAIRDGEADLALIAQPDGRSPFLPDFQLFSFAYVACYLIVNEENTLQEINFPNLRVLYMQDAENASLTWADVGMSGRMASRKIVPYAVVTDRAVGLELFKHEALDQGQLSPQVIVLSSVEKAFEQVSKNSNAIAMVPVPPGEFDGVRTLSISRGQGADDYAFGPTQENIDFGDYPLRLPIMLAIPRDNAPPSELLKYLYSDEVANHLSESGFMPVPENVRKRYLLELDIRR